MNIYLLRHGDCTTDGVKRYVGQIDYPLSELGIQQARAWRGFFAAHVPDRVVCSDLTRTIQTAENAVGSVGVRIEREPGFREISLGAWEGVSRQEVRTRFPGAYAQRGKDLAGFRPPEGESFLDLQKRVVAAFKALCSNLDPDAVVLVVTHAGVIRVLLCHILGIRLGQMFSLGVDYARMTHLEAGRKGWVVRWMNVPAPSV
ncbi:histidine phosphatase family protein [Desulfoplanes formicivorans]|uniref:Phosphoglycerate mutase n=1 Tax=Desulfoplanes formicivorans TaxID=1592317 RepID=A0A194ADY8_9BACT|nr:histidine phosphatase family protein [Desulfoplanes formicivorans]GAU07415.1 phosphoglycerate mutase [Desulfoplanes formicivorans]